MNRSFLKALSILIILILLLPSEVVTAQGTPASGPVYIVQEGDSLWDIAYRFHVSQEELANANGITNTDQITVGQQLVIPGLEEIQGILTTQSVPYGEDLQSLSMRYHISPQSLMRLNHIISPNEIYAGYSLIIPQNDTSTTFGKRVILDAGQSMLELAILNNTDPWTMMVNNSNQNSWSVLPGQILRVPGEDDTGPGALTPTINSINITGLTQGETAEIQVGGEEDLSLSGSLIGHTLNFFPDTDNHYVALQGVHAMAEPGLYPLNLQVTSPEGLSQTFSQMVLVQASDFPYDRSLPVDPATLDPETNRKENELWFAASSAVTPEKIWDGNFSIPVDPVFAECYSSRFGNRRSYNGGEYLYFHTGLDFCGQVGDPVYAAASGIVVFADSLTVRGKATMIDHGWGIYTAYMHQSEILVSVGEHVEKGQLIGRVGNTGRVEGPHLHFEVLVGGIQVDPLEWLNTEFP
jgi:murein DD-endopeptidase MepM/ murein hydrolase activator NlpD